MRRKKRKVRKLEQLPQFDCLLPSEVPGLYFSARFTVTWSITADLTNQAPESLLRDSIRTLAAGAVTDPPYPITAVNDVEDRLNSVLGNSHQLNRPGIIVSEAHASVSIDKQTQFEARAFTQKQRDQYLADITQRAEIERVREFRTQVLGDTRTALSYWFLKNPHETANKARINDIEDLVHKVADRDPELLWINVAKTLQAVASNLPPQRVGDFLERLVSSLYAIGKDDEANQILNHAKRHHAANLPASHSDQFRTEYSSTDEPPRENTERD